MDDLSEVDDELELFKVPPPGCGDNAERPPVHALANNNNRLRAQLLSCPPRVEVSILEFMSLRRSHPAHNTIEPNLFGVPLEEPNGSLVR